MKTSRIKLLMTFAPTGTYVRDHKTTPEVVNISKVSNMTKVKGSENVAKGRRGTVRRAHVGYDEGPCTLLPDGRNSEVPTTPQLKAEIQPTLTTCPIAHPVTLASPSFESP
jgi:hypothetical protein